MAKDSKSLDSAKRSKERTDLLDGMKSYFGIENEDDDYELLKYIGKQARLHQEE
jgi:hypothetical protein